MACTTIRFPSTETMIINPKMNPKNKYLRLRFGFVNTINIENLLVRQNMSLIFIRIQKRPSFKTGF